MAETAQAEEKADKQQADSKTQVQSVDLPEAAGTDAAGSDGSIGILLDMDVPITVAIGKTEIPIRRLLQLGPGSVLRLDKPVDAPADLYLRGNRFATGDIVVVENRFAIRIKQVLKPSDSTTEKKTE